MYSIVKGRLFKTYTGTVACTGLSVHGVYKTLDEVRKIIDDLYDNETDLILVIDLNTGLEANLNEEK